MSSIYWKKEIFTIPNMLSMLRICTLPVNVLLYLNASTTRHYFLSSIILAASCLTDLLDGQIARKFNMVSTLGKVLDPVADKSTQFSLIICLLIRKNLPLLWLLCFIFIAKESFQLIAGIILLQKKKMLSGALIEGKLATTVLFSSFIVLIMIPKLSDHTVNLFAILNVIFLVISFASYVFAYAGLIKKIELI